MVEPFVEDLVVVHLRCEARKAVQVFDVGGDDGFAAVVRPATASGRSVHQSVTVVRLALASTTRRLPAEKLLPQRAGARVNQFGKSSAIPYVDFLDPGDEDEEASLLEAPGPLVRRLATLRHKGVPNELRPGVRLAVCRLIKIVSVRRDDPGAHAAAAYHMFVFEINRWPCR